jgi:hypothetical protein
MNIAAFAGRSGMKVCRTMMSSLQILRQNARAIRCGLGDLLPGELPEIIKFLERDSAGGLRQSAELHVS